MLRLILDTDTTSEILRGVNPVVKGHMDAYRRAYGQLDFTSATAFEVLYGFHRVPAPAQLRRALALLAVHREIVPDSDDYHLAAKICGELDLQGTPIGVFDPLIAACAIRRGYGVASGNTRHFGYIQRAGYAFHLEDWRRP